MIVFSGSLHLESGTVFLSTSPLYSLYWPSKNTWRHIYSDCYLVYNLTCIFNLSLKLWLMACWTCISIHITIVIYNKCTGGFAVLLWRCLVVLDYRPLFVYVPLNTFQPTNRFWLWNSVLILNTCEWQLQTLKYKCLNICFIFALVPNRLCRTDYSCSLSKSSWIVYQPRVHHLLEAVL